MDQELEDIYTLDWVGSVHLTCKAGHAYALLLEALSIFDKMDISGITNRAYSIKCNKANGLLELDGNMSNYSELVKLIFEVCPVQWRLDDAMRLRKPEGLTNGKDIGVL